jgi:nitrogenase-associated protein
MATVIFYEKPGCMGNARQKRLLLDAGHDLEPRNLLAEPWTPESLRPFFGNRPVADWFNRSASAVKSGAIDPDRFDEVQALAALIADPILIRRPLLQVGDRREVGFDTALVGAWIGLDQAPADNIEGCPRGAAMPAGSCSIP